MLSSSGMLNSHRIGKLGIINKSLQFRTRFNEWVQFISSYLCLSLNSHHSDQSISSKSATMENQPMLRPWSRLASQIRRDQPPPPPPRPQAPLIPQPRPPLVRAPTILIRPPPPPTPTSPPPPPPPPPQPRSPAPPSTQVPLPSPPKPQTSPPRRAAASPQAPPLSPAKVPVPSASSLPPSPVASPPAPKASSLLSSPRSLKVSPSQVTTTVSPPLQSPKIVPPPSQTPPPESPKTKPSAPPPSPLTLPPSQPVTNISPPRQYPKIFMPSSKSPPLQSPNSKLSARPPSPLSLPPSQLKPDIEPPLVAEKKSVVVQEEREKPKMMQMPAAKTITGLNNGKFGGGNRDPHIKDKEKVGMRVITLAGENKGAYMDIFNPNKNKTDTAERNGINGKKLGTNNHSGRDEDRKSVMEDITVTETQSRTFVNSNVQGVNNSILFNTSFTHHDPGVHLVLPGKPKHLPDRYHINGYHTT